MNKRAIVLGGGGLIGSHLSLRLLREGYEVICIDRQERGNSKLLSSIDNREKFHYIKHDITTPYEISCDELYNLAASEYRNKYDCIDNLHIAAIGSINTLDTLVKNSSRVLYGSSGDVYNYYNDGDFAVDGKRFGESLHLAYHYKYKIDSRIARIFSTYGSYSGLDTRHTINRIIIEALNNRNIVIHGSGEQQESFCWVDDMVDGLVRLMRTPSDEGLITADLGSATRISIKSITELIIELTGSRSKIIYSNINASDGNIKMPDLTVAQNELHWQTRTPLREGLLRTIRYIEKELSALALSQMSWVEIYG